MNERKSTKAWVRLGPGATYLVGVFVLGLVPGGAPPAHVSDKLAHAVAFGLMVPFALWAAPYFGRDPAFRTRGVVAVLASSAAGALLEYWQAFVPYRDAEFLDWVADTVGAIVVVSICAGVVVLMRRLDRPRRTA